VTSFIYVEIDE